MACAQTQIRYHLQVSNCPRTRRVSDASPSPLFDGFAYRSDKGLSSAQHLHLSEKTLFRLMSSLLSPQPHSRTFTMLHRFLPLCILAFLPTPFAQLHPECPPHNYTTHILSISPLVIYIPSFISPSEVLHLHSVSSGTFTSSQIADDSGQQHLASTRTSQSTSLRSDDIIRCIEQRALDFQGFDTKRESLEPLQLVKHAQDQQYHAHTDWFTSPAQTTSEFGGNRLSSFFVYVHASPDIIGGGTQFPLLDALTDERWCEWVNCDAEIEDGVVFRPVQGNAVFWRNLVEVKKGGKKEFVGDRRTVHAGLPVQRGAKVGMNIWTREGVLDERYRSG